MFRKILNPLLAHRRAVSGTIPADHIQLLTQNVRKVLLKSCCLTHALTQQMTHVFGSPVWREMSVLPGAVAKFQIQIIVHFLPVFRAAKKLSEIPARILTQMNDTAYSLSYLITFKTVIL
jgi:hypothetical protein